MRNVVFSYAVLCGLTGSASAAEQGLASYFQYSRFAGLVAAHRSLPMGSQVRVVNLDNGRSVVVTIVGRGPFIRGRVIDVSTEAKRASPTCALIRFSVPGVATIESLTMQQSRLRRELVVKALARLAHGPQTVEDGRFDVDEGWAPSPMIVRPLDARPRAASSRWRGRRR
jgi:rare lipoprotein A